MTVMETPKNVAVWIDTTRCKACDICASVCPAGVIAMKADPSSTLGSMVDLIAREDCIGCCDCELSCPDFAIHVADKSEYKFVKLSDEAKMRSEKLKNNKYRVQG